MIVVIKTYQELVLNSDLPLSSCSPTRFTTQGKEDSYWQIARASLVLGPRWPLWTRAQGMISVTVSVSASSGLSRAVLLMCFLGSLLSLLFSPSVHSFLVLVPTQTSLPLPCVCFDLILIAAPPRVRDLSQHGLTSRWSWLLWLPWGTHAEPAFLGFPSNLVHAVMPAGRMFFPPFLYLNNASAFFKVQVRFLPLSLMAGNGLSSELAEFPVRSSGMVFTPFCTYLLFRCM